MGVLVEIDNTNKIGNEYLKILKMSPHFCPYYHTKK
jgi:hypothetical protein